MRTVFYFDDTVANDWSSQLVIQLTQASHHYHRRHQGDDIPLPTPFHMALRRGNVFSLHNAMVTELTAVATTLILYV